MDKIKHARIAMPPWLVVFNWYTVPNTVHLQLLYYAT
jgi:hypothetical protein